MAASLVTLPEEIITRIASHLQSYGIYSLRLTCRTVCTKSQYHFCRTFFRKRKYRFDRDELATLLQIAHHPEFKNFVEELHIELERWNHVTLHCKILEVGSRHCLTDLKHPANSSHIARLEDELGDLDRPEFITENCARFDTEIGERIRMIEDGYELDVLQQTIPLLPKLREVRLTEMGGHHCFQAGSIVGIPCGDDMMKMWLLLGEEMGGLHRLQLLERHHLFSLFLQALSSASPPDLQSLDVCITDYEYLNPPPGLRPDLLPNLQSLSVSFIASFNDVRRDRFGQGTDPSIGLRHGSWHSPPKASLIDPNWLLDLATSCKRLKRLELRFPNDSFGRAIAGLGGRVQFSSLEHFCMQGGRLLDMREPSLHKGLETFLLDHRSTLKSLHLADLKLGFAEYNAWPEVYTTGHLLKVLATMEKLEEISLEHFRENSMDDSVIFENTSTGSPSSRDAWTFAAPPESMKVSLSELSEEYTLRHWR